MSLTEEQINQFKADHGKIAVITLPLPDGAPPEAEPQELVVKKAPPVVWADYQESITKEKGTHTNNFRRLCYACLVHPDQKAVEAIFRDYPALPTKIANTITEMSGQGDEFEVKKL